MNSQCSGPFQCGPSSICLLLSINTFSSSTSAEELREITDNQLGSCRRIQVKTEAEDFKFTLLSENPAPSYSHGIAGLVVLGKVGL